MQSIFAMPISWLLMGKIGAFDTNQLKPYMKSLQSIAPNVSWRLLEGACHLQKLGELSGEIAQWMNQQLLDTLPDLIDWQLGAAAPYQHEVFWLQVNQLSDERDPSIFPSLNTLEPRFRNHDLIWTYGLAPDRLKKGANIMRLYEHGALARAGLQKGDFIKKIGDFEINSSQESNLINHFFTENEEKKMPVVFQRGALIDTTSLHIEADDYHCFYNTKRARRIRVEKKENNIFAQADGIQSFTLFLHPEQFNFNTGIDVYLNGQKILEKYQPTLLDFIRTKEREWSNVGRLKVDLPSFSSKK